MGIIATIIVGFIAGVLAKLIVPGNRYEPAGFIMTTILGIVGAFVANFIADRAGWSQSGGFLSSILYSTAGAVIVLVVYVFIASRTRSDTI